jgi:hypothetical protein
MPSFPSQELLRGLRRDTEELIRIAEREIVPLRPEQLLWKPVPGKWSVAQCLEHLNRYGLHYLPAMQSRIDAALVGGSRPEPTFRSGWLGNFLIRTVQPMHTRAVPGRTANTHLPKLTIPTAPAPPLPKRCRRSCSSNEPPSNCSKGRNA